MANNYTEASFTFKCGSHEQAEAVDNWLSGNNLPLDLKAKIVKYDDYIFDEENACFQYLAAEGQIESADGDLWIHLDNGSLEILVMILDHAMQTFPDIPSPQGFEWASWCSKPRIDEFTGGAVLIERGQEPEFHTTSQWLSDALNGGGKL